MVFISLGVYFFTKKDNIKQKAEQPTEKSIVNESTTVSSPIQPNVQPSSKPVSQTVYAVSEVVQHNSSASCWSVVGDGVYDLTSWIVRHPGGPDAIKGICGKDGTKNFYGQHQGQTKPENILVSFKIGILKK